MSAPLSVTLKAVDQISSKLDDIANSGDKVATKLDSVRNTANDAFDKMTSGTSKAQQSMESASQAAEGFANNGAKAEASLNGQAEAAEKTGEKVKGLGEEVDETGEKSEESSEKGKKAAMTLGDALAAAGIVEGLKKITEAYYECDDASDTFETSLAKVSTIADPTQESMSDIQQSIRALSQETGKSASDLAESTYSAISASVDTANAVNFVSQANALSVGGFTANATAVDILTTALNAYQMSADQTEHVSDVLITTQNLGKTTVDQLGQSMGMVIPTAAAYGVSIEQLGAAYAVMTAKGVNTANATTNMNRMFAELADTGSIVAGILKDVTGKSFTELMESGKSLGDVLDILYQSVNGNATAFSNLWGSAVAGRGALSIVSSGADHFNDVVDQMTNSTGAAQKAFETMENTGEVTQEKFDNAVKNFQISIGNAQPQLDGLMKIGTKVLGQLSQFVDENPDVVKGIESIVISVGLFTAAMLAYTAGSALAAKATIALTAAMDTNPIFLVVTAFAALAVGIAVFVSTCEDAEYQDQRLTAASQDMSDEIDRQETTVKNLTATYGENAEQTLEAKAKLEELKAEYADAGETIGEFKKKIHDTDEAVSNSAKTYGEAVESLKDQQSNAAVMVAELQRLENQSNKTAFQQEYEAQIVKDLNDVYPELGLAYDETTGKLNKSTISLKSYCDQKREQLKLEQDAQTYIEYMNEMDQYLEEQKTAQENLNAAKDEYNRLLSEGTTGSIGGNDIDSSGLESARENMEDAQQVADGLTDKINDLQGKMSELDGSAEGAANSINDASNSSEKMITTSEDLRTAMSSIFDGVKEQSEDLADAYASAYKAATSSVDSSFGLFEKIEDTTSISASKMVDALKSQEDYLEEYNSNLEKAKKYGLDSSLISNLADGSQESASSLDTIIDKIEKLGTNSSSAKKYVDELNDSFDKVQDAKKTLEDTMVSMNETLTTKMDSLKTTMQKGVDNLNLSSSAADAAKKTMDAYTQAIENHKSDAVKAADAVAAAVSAALNKANVSSNTTTKHASGTTYGEDVYIAGEEGPELIVGRQGSEVFPASETAKILQAVISSRENTSEETAVPSDITKQIIETKSSESIMTQNKNITLTLKGKGAIGINGGTTMDDVKKYISSELEGTIVKMLMTEMQEEGDAAYDY